MQAIHILQQKERFIPIDTQSPRVMALFIQSLILQPQLLFSDKNIKILQAMLP